MRFFIPEKEEYKNLSYETEDENILQDVCILEEIPYDPEKDAFLVSSEKFISLFEAVQRRKELDSLISCIEEERGSRPVMDVLLNGVRSSEPYSFIKTIEETEDALREHFPEFFA